MIFIKKYVFKRKKLKIMLCNILNKYIKLII